MNFCSHCSQPVKLQIPEGDNLPRYVCSKCGMIHYQNPNIVTGTIPLWNNKILLCKRAIEPRKGYWTVPAGFMENKETVQQGATRETMEEAQAKTDNLKLFGIFNLPHISQVYMMFTATVKDGICAPGTESLETEWFDETEIPWDELSFPVIDEALKLYFKAPDKVHLGDVYRNENNQIVINRY